MLGLNFLLMFECEQNTGCQVTFLFIAFIWELLWDINAFHHLTMKFSLVLKQILAKSML